MITRSARRRCRRARQGAATLRHITKAMSLRRRIRMAEAARQQGKPLHTERGHFVPVRRWRERLSRLFQPRPSGEPATA